MALRVQPDVTAAVEPLIAPLRKYTHPSGVAATYGAMHVRRTDKNTEYAFAAAMGEKCGR